MGSFNFGLEKIGLVAAVGACSVIGMSYMSWKATRHGFLNSTPVKDSMDLLHGYTHAKSIFGNEIKPSLVDTSHQFYNRTEGVANLPIRFTGDMKSGILYSYLIKDEEKSKDKSEIWHVQRLDVEIADTNKRWTFYMDPNSKLECFIDSSKPEDRASEKKS